MADTYEGMGMLTEDGQLQLDKSVPLPPGRVRVRVETVPGARCQQPHILDLVGQSGLARTREDIDAQLRALREEWGE